MSEVCALGPVDPASITKAEEENAAPWIVRKLVGSMTGRIVMSSWETLRASGTSVICLSPWGDSSPFLLPCVRFRDLAVHTIVAATGGMAAVASPVMGPISDAIVTTLGDTILVELGMHAGFEATTRVADDLILDRAVNAMIPIHSRTFETTGIKELLITLKYKQMMTDASLGFYRSSVHKSSSLFSSVIDYLSTEKGWFSPYLFASGRRPIIPRSMTPDVVFCHGPFVPGDYGLGETLLAESAFAMIMAAPQPPPSNESPHPSHHSLSLPELPKLSNLFLRSRTPSPEPSLTPLPLPPMPRRMLVTVVGLKPHRAGLWTTSQRPSESVMYYQLLNGCPAIVVPVKLGVPLVAWDTLTLEELWKVPLPDAGKGESLEEGKFGGIVKVFCEYLDLCVDWNRVVLPDPNKAAAGEKETQTLENNGATAPGEDKLDKQRSALKQAVTMLAASAIRSGDNKEIRDKINKDRSGIAMWRIP